MRISRLSPACALALVVSVVVAPQASAGLRPTAPVKSALSASADVESPSEQAARTGRRVEVSSERSATETTFANPDGTFTLETSSAPVRGRTASGAWQAIDLTLEKRADGSLRPHAPALETVFSGGGSGALVQLSQDGHDFALGWPAPLPTPVLDGPAALYREVLPGIDLRMTATDDGYRQVLVVKSREAAESAALREVRFTLDAPGLPLRSAVPRPRRSTVGPGTTSSPASARIGAPREGS